MIDYGHSRLGLVWNLVNGISIRLIGIPTTVVNGTMELVCGALSRSERLIIVTLAILHKLLSRTGDLKITIAGGSYVNSC